MSNNGSMTKTTTIPGKYKRLKYFHGMLLTEHDFQEEQTYFREKLRLHNRFHGQGVVWGLSLKPDQPESSKIIIEGGVALDCVGNEIIVCNDYEIDLYEKIAWLQKMNEIKDPCSPPEEPSKLYIGIKYCECEAEPVQQYTSTCEEDPLQPEFSRVREGFCEVVLTKDELPECWQPPQEDCKTPGERCPGAAPHCADDHIVFLGCVEIRKPEIYEIGEAKIVMDNKRKTVYTPSGSYWPLRYWEDSKQAVIHTICQATGLVDISGAIGKEVAAARSFLTNLGMEVSEDLLPSSLVSYDQLLTIRSALSCVPEGSMIQLITDEEMKCVLFPFLLRETMGSPPG